MQLVATYDNVIMAVLKKERKKGLIALPDSQSDESDFCKVVSVGQEVEGFHVGDIVLRPTPAEYEYIDEGDNNKLYLIVPQRSIVAIKSYGGDE